MKSNDQMRGNRDYMENNIPDNQQQKSANEQQQADKTNKHNISDKDNPASIKDLPEIKPARTGILG